MLKLYRFNGATFQWREGEQPAGAVEVKATEPAAKAKAPANKARTGSRSK